jgi:MFS family permease
LRSILPHETNHTSPSVIVTLSYASSRRSIYRPVRHFYIAESLAGHAANLLLVGVFFYTQKMFGWGIEKNLLLACGQGAFYMTGALSAGKISGKFGRRNMLLCLQPIMICLAAMAIIFPRPLVITMILLIYPGFAATAWPALESLISQGADGHVLIKRLSMYNLTWSATNAVTLAISGVIIQHFPVGLFVLPIIAHVLAGCFIRFGGGSNSVAEQTPIPHHAEPEPELLQMRTLALWLSRIALPSTYVVVYSLSAMMPSLPVMHSLQTQTKTLVSAVWLVSRWFAFLILGATSFWHTRPRLMLTATAIMLVAFLGITVRPSDLFPSAHVPQAIDLLAMITWQILLGMVLGIIYSASLYFGMVLSDGATEHGGYHEALIGLGSVLGPGTAAVAHMIQPEGISLSVTAVAGLIGISLASATTACAFAAKRKTPGFPIETS